MTDIVKHFDVLSKYGMQVIPLHKGGKNPIFSSWQSDYDPSRCRHFLHTNPSSNIGLRLGDIIDVEGDSPHANSLINELIGEYPHPSYTSQKSIHHLFTTPDPVLTRVVFQEIEFRGQRHQSVLPPSVVNGVQYKWRTTVFPIPPMPDRLLKFFEKIRSKKTPNRTKPGHMKLPCATCRNDCYIHRKRFQEELAVFKSFGQPWQCRKCRTMDVRPFCRRQRQSHLLEA